MVKIIKLLISFILAGVLLQACVINPTSEPQNNFPWINEWLLSTTCNAPCWEGISPGTTTLNEISNKSINPKYQLIFDGPFQDSSGLYYLDWEITYKSNSYPVVTASTMSNTDNTIGEINFKLGYYGNKITVNDIILHFGEPPEIGIYQEGEVIYCRAVLLYPDKNIWIELVSQKLSPSFRLEKDTLISEANFYSKSKWNVAINNILPNPGQIQTWKGLNENYECRSTK
jgi:hypothetical protein